MFRKLKLFHILCTINKWYWCGRVGVYPPCMFGRHLKTSTFAHAAVIHGSPVLSSNQPPVVHRSDGRSDFFFLSLYPLPLSFKNWLRTCFSREPKLRCLEKQDCCIYICKHLTDKLHSANFTCLHGINNWFGERNQTDIWELYVSSIVVGRTAPSLKPTPGLEIQDCLPLFRAAS